MRAITLDEVRALDCAAIQASVQHRRDILGTIRGHFYRNRDNGFGDYDFNCSDEELFLYAYAKYSLAKRDDSQVIARVKREFDNWQFQYRVPDYICSYYRLALEQKLNAHEEV